MGQLPRSLKEQFWGDGWCLARQLLRSTDLDPIRGVISRSVEARAAKLHREGHIQDVHAGEGFEKRWSKVAADAVAAGAQFREGNWGQAAMLDRSIYELLIDRRLTDLVADLLGEGELVVDAQVFHLGRYLLQGHARCNGGVGHLNAWL